MQAGQSRCRRHQAKLSPVHRIVLAGFVKRAKIYKVVSDVTRILQAAQQGDPKAADELLPLVYDALRKLAAHRMANEAPGQTLQPTALVPEAWLRLAGSEHQTWRSPSLAGDSATANSKTCRIFLPTPLLMNES